ncbi:MAG: hypothetical protein E7625_04810 [Ruminococcaceae bacterium]|nr:hypothetical protein [Oscillospiraceae bacterium]
MGWGLLFFGYFLEYILGLNSLFAPFVHVIAYAMMYAGLSGLQRYCKRFRYAKWCAIALAILSVWRTFAQAETALGITFGFVVKEITTVVSWLDFAGSIIFHVALAFAVKEIAQRLSVSKNAVRAVRNLVLVLLYGVLFVVHALIPTEQVALVVYPPLVLSRVAFAICNCVLLYSCYMRIVPAGGGEDAPRAPSRFGAINRMRRAFDEKEKQAIEADRQYHADNARRRYEKQTARMSQKQRAKEELRNKRHRD